MKLGFIGTGNMAGAIMGGIIKKRNHSCRRDHWIRYYGNGKKSCERTVWNPGDSG